MAWARSRPEGRNKTRKRGRITEASSGKSPIILDSESMENVETESTAKKIKKNLVQYPVAISKNTLE